MSEKIFIGKDMPESMYPAPRRPYFPRLSARGTGADPEPDAMRFLVTLGRHIDGGAVFSLIEFHRLIFFGKALTREGLIACLRMKWGRDWVDRLQQKMLIGGAL